MKKLLAVLLAALMLIAFAGCGNDKKSDTPTDSAKTETTQSEPDSTEKYESLQDYLDDPANTKGMNELEGSMGDTVKFSVNADGNTIVYDYRFLTAMDSSTLGSVKQTLDTALDSYDATYKNTVSDIQNKVDEAITLRVVYHTVDGTVITERTYKP